MSVSIPGLKAEQRVWSPILFFSINFTGLVVNAVITGSSSQKHRKPSFPVDARYLKVNDVSMCAGIYTYIIYIYIYVHVGVCCKVSISLVKVH